MDFPFTDVRSVRQRECCIQFQTHHQEVSKKHYTKPAASIHFSDSGGGGGGGGGGVRKMPKIFGALLAQNHNIKICKNENWVCLGVFLY